MKKKINLPFAGETILEFKTLNPDDFKQNIFEGKSRFESLPDKVIQEIASYPVSPYDTKGFKFGSQKLSIKRTFEFQLPEKINFIQLEHADNFSKAPLLIFNYDNNDRKKVYKFMWAGETETIDPEAIEDYIGYCRIQGNIQHLLILK